MKTDEEKWTNDRGVEGGNEAGRPDRRRRSSEDQISDDGETQRPLAKTKQIELDDQRFEDLTETREWIEAEVDEVGRLDEVEREHEWPRRNWLTRSKFERTYEK